MNDLYERSQYFRGLLLLIARDGKISPDEKKILLKIGQVLGFDREFCLDSIESILNNRHISREVPRFIRKKMAKAFLLDGIRLASSDGELHLREFDWLRKIGMENGISRKWFSRALNATLLTENISKHSLAVEWLLRNEKFYRIKSVVKPGQVKLDRIK
ncbi:MAG: hypothetical protein Kow0037_06710 [Calditrichia bacterium]